MNVRVSVRVIVVASLTLVAALLPRSVAAQPAGEAVAVDQSAAAAGAQGSRELSANAPIFMGDQVTTDATGLAQLKFRDDTRMVVGPNSELTIDSFVFADDTTASQVTLDAARGVFRFITGNSPKSAYLIDTPVATIGVRGSRADILVPGNNTVSVVSYDEGDGANEGLYVCDKPELRETDRDLRYCVELTRGCSFVIFAAGAMPEWVPGVYRKTTLMDAIPFAFNQSGLLADFQVESRSCENRDPNPPKGGQPPVVPTPPSPQQEDGEED